MNEAEGTARFGLLGRVVFRGLAGLAAGMCLGVVDTADLLLEGYGSGLSALDAVAVLASSVLALGGLGGAAGVCLSFVVDGLARLGLVWDAARGVLFRGRLLMGAKKTTAWALASLMGLIAGSIGLFRWLLLGTGRMELSDPLLLVALGGSAVVFVVTGFVLSRLRAPTRGFVLVGAASLVLLYVLESRLIYTFSRLAPLSYVHGLLLLVLLLVVGIGWACHKGLRRWVAGRPRAQSVVLLVVLLAAGLFSRTLLSTNSHRVRLVLNERTVLVFRTLEMLPRLHSYDRDQLLEELRGSAPCATANLESPHPAPPAEGAQVRGVVILMLDGLRGDRLVGHVRAGEPITPNLTKLSQRAVRFTRAYTTVPATSASMASMMTSRYSTEVDEAELNARSLGPLLQRAGVKTLAVSAHKNLRATMEMWDVYDESFAAELLPDGKNALTSEKVVGRALELLETVQPTERFLLFVHLYDPHAHYVGNPMFDFGSSEIERYDAEIAYTDHWVGRFLETLDRAGEEVAVVVLGDHGDEFLEHRYTRHQLRLYDESARVAFMLRAPNHGDGSAIDTPVTTLDLAPTVLDLLGLPIAESMRGRSLLGFSADRTPPPERAVFMHTLYGAKWGVVHDHDKLIVDIDNGIVELYDLELDPHEEQNLADLPSSSSVLPGLACRLQGWMDTLPE